MERKLPCTDGKLLAREHYESVQIIKRTAQPLEGKLLRLVLAAQLTLCYLHHRNQDSRCTKDCIGIRLPAQHMSSALGSIWIQLLQHTVEANNSW